VDTIANAAITLGRMSAENHNGRQTPRLETESLKAIVAILANRVAAHYQSLAGSDFWQALCCALFRTRIAKHVHARDCRD
jgi:hypothetical protein